jgi:hypothetical protein
MPENATMAEIEAICDRGIDALLDAHEAGEEADVAFYPYAQRGEAEGHNINVVTQHDDDDDEDDTENEEEEMKTLEKTDDESNCEIACPDCGEEPCVFEKHEELLAAFDDAEHGCSGAEEVPSNNVRRKKLYRQLTLMLNGGPLGAGVRKPLPTCCVAAIRKMLPSETFMGFKTE